MKSLMWFWPLNNYRTIETKENLKIIRSTSYLERASFLDSGIRICWFWPIKMKANRFNKKRWRQQKFKNGLFELKFGMSKVFETGIPKMMVPIRANEIFIVILALRTMVTKEKFQNSSTNLKFRMDKFFDTGNLKTRNSKLINEMITQHWPPSQLRIISKKDVLI